MDITLRQIKDYLHCPMIFKFKYRMGIEIEDDGDHNLVDALKNTIFYFYHSLMGEKLLTQYQIVQKFGNLLYSGLNSYDILTSQKMDLTMSSVNVTGIKAVKAFYERERRRNPCPICVGTEVKVPVGSNILAMELDLVREVKINKEKFIDVVSLSGVRKMDAFTAAHDIDTTAQCYAFRKLFPKEENRLILNTVRNGKEYAVKRKEPELKRLEAVVTGVCASVERGDFYPVHDDRCEKCQYKEVCHKYKF